MAKASIGLGAAPNDGNGDDLRTAGGKINANFNEIYTALGDGSALGTYQVQLAEGAFVDGDKTKLDGIETAADVTDTANVTAAGALMDSEVTNLAQVKAFDSTDYAAASHTHTASDIDAEASTDGYVLTSDGAGNAAWEAVPSGGSPEGTSVLSTGEVGGTKFLREDGDGTSSWQSVPATAWDDPIDASITVDTDSTYDLATSAARIANGFFDQVYASGAFLMTEVADNPVTPVAGLSQLWTSDDTTQKLMFTDDAGTDKEVAFVTGGTDLSAYTGVLGLNSGTAVDVNTKALLEARLSDVSDLAEADGDVWTGVHDFGGATSLEIPNSATPTVDAAGEIAIDTTVTDWSHGIMEYFSGEVMGVVAMPIAQFTTPSDGAVPTYNATNDEFEMAVPAGSGDVSKVGTPVDGQVGVWTGNGTIEGDAALTFDTTDDTLVIAASGKLGFGAVDILSDSAGTTTLQNIDALDATTEATIEAAIDTLANLTSVQGHTVTLTGDFVRSGAHSLTLTTGATTNVTLPASGTLAVLGANEFTGTQDFNGQQIEAYLNKVVTSVTGSLTTTAHAGNILVTSGNVTVPTTAGFSCILIAGGAHTVTFNGTTSAAMAAGDIMTVAVESATVIHAVLTAAADKVSFT